MNDPRSSTVCPAFPPTPGTPIVFAARRRSDAKRRGVRESGHDPDDPDARSPCWHHDDPGGCVALGNLLAIDRDARRLTSIGVDLLLWTHAKRASTGIPQHGFLSRFEPDRRWSDGSAPPLGLARAAVLYHLPLLAADRRTPAELFEDSLLFERLCPAEREWLLAARRARMSFFEVKAAKNRVVLLRDCFRDLSGRGDLAVLPGEIESGPVEPGATVFARVIPFRKGNYVDLRQLTPATADPDTVRESGRELRDRTQMLTALFEAWSSASPALERSEPS